MSKGKKRKSERTAAPAATPRVAKPKIKFQEPTPKKAAGPARALTFGPDTYKWMGIGFALVVVGLILMSGSRGDNFAEFNEDVIYSPVKITLAPAIILAGLGTVIYAILKK